MHSKCRVYTAKVQTSGTAAAGGNPKFEDARFKYFGPGTPKLEGWILGFLYAVALSGGGIDTDCGGCSFLCNHIWELEMKA